MIAWAAELPGFGDESGELGSDWLWSTFGNGQIQVAQLGRLPGVVGAVQAVEFAQHGGDRLAAMRWLVADDEDLDAGAENVSLLLLQRGATAGGDDDEQQRGKGGTQHARQASSGAVRASSTAAARQARRPTTP